MAASILPQTDQSRGAYCPIDLPAEAQATLAQVEAALRGLYARPDNAVTRRDRDNLRLALVATAEAYAHNAPLYDLIEELEAHGLADLAKPIAALWRARRGDLPSRVADLVHALCQATPGLRADVLGEMGDYLERLTPIGVASVLYWLQHPDDGLGYVPASVTAGLEAN